MVVVGDDLDGGAEWIKWFFGQASGSWMKRSGQWNAQAGGFHTYLCGALVPA